MPIGNRPSAIGDRPSGIGHRGSAIGDRPSAIGHRGSAIGHRPSAIGDRPSAIGDSSRTPLDRDEKILADNIRYFGEPVYEYDLSQGIEDGYLAPPEIFAFDLFHDQKTTPERTTPVLRSDLAGKKITEVTTHRPISPEALKDAFSQTEIDEQIFPIERTQALARHFFWRLIEHGGDPEQKTILFCASDLHADRMANELNALYQDW